MESEPEPATHKILTGSVPPERLADFLQSKLAPLLPYSLPLYRRCQFYLSRDVPALLEQPTVNTTEQRPADPEVWVAVAVAVATAPSDHDEFTSWLSSSSYPRPTDNGSDCLLAAYLDLREPGQTQVWFFGSWEAKAKAAADGRSPSSSTPSRVQRTLAQLLFDRIRTHHVSKLSREPTSQYLSLRRSGKIVSPGPYRRSKVLFGTLAEASDWILEDDVVLGVSTTDASTSTATTTPGKQNTVVTRADRSYLKYLLPLPLSETKPAAATTTTKNSSPLQPEGEEEEEVTLRPGPLTEKHLQTVLDRTPIPRTLELLKTLVSVGLFPPNDPNPVAWGILSKDASVSSLHTEEAYRGRGLAAQITRELLGLQHQVLGFGLDATCTVTTEAEAEAEAEAVEWAHTDVSERNVSSRRVFEKMGATIGWRVGWIEVDVDVDTDRTS